jgi:hypothetical protein
VYPGVVKHPSVSKYRHDPVVAFQPGGRFAVNASPTESTKESAIAGSDEMHRAKAAKVRIKRLI